MGIPLRVLSAEDSKDDAVLLLRELRRGGYEPIFKRVDTPAAMVAELEKETWDIVISDYVMLQFSGLEALELVQKKGLDLPFIVVSGRADEETLVGAMKAGVHDYILKSNLARLVPALQRELRETVVRRERKKAEDAQRKSEEEAKRLAQENAIMAEIGRIISSTLNIEEVYALFSKKVRSLLPCDRIAINLINEDGTTLINRYVEGDSAHQRNAGEVFPMAGTLTEAVIQNRGGLTVNSQDEEEMAAKFPGLLPERKAGFRSFLSVPLISGDKPIGGLHFRSKRYGAYSEKDLKLAESTANQIAGAVANAQLYNERKRVEKALKKSEEKFRDLYDSAPVGYHEYDTEGRITNVNRTDLEMLGYSREEMIGQYIWKFNVEEDTSRPQILEKLAGLRPPGHSLERIYRRKDGTTFPVLIEDRLNKNEQGRITGIRCTIQDISVSKQAEKELKEINEQLEHATARANEMAMQAELANIAKSQFLANMSHEIRTPMNGVIGMTGLLLDTRLSPEQREYAEAVRSSADSLLRLINDILDFSKIEAGKLDLEILDFDLRMAVEDTVDMIAVKAEEKELELACDIHHDVPALLRGDPGRLRQILLNLTGNAIKFTEKGEVLIRVALEDEDDTHAKVRFSVKDTGIGIPKDRVDRLFKSFSQLDASTTRKFGGTGLGLAISKKLVEMMGGQIGVESEKGKGSTVWFTAIFEKQSRDGKTVPPIPMDIQGLKILVVDDNPINRTILREQLRSWGCLPEEAPDGESALAKLRGAMEDRSPFDLAILDMAMPDMDGAMLGRKIKADPKLCSTALVLLTSRGNRGDAREMQKIGFAGYLTKPIKGSQLRDCLAVVVSRKSPESKIEPRPLVTRYSVAENNKRRIRILLAEDNIINQKVALRQLEKIGYRADAVANGKEVLSALEGIPYDLILMDVQMPEMDGFEATAAIRWKERGTGGHIPIIAMTAHAMKGDRERCLEAGMDDYVPKPIQPQSLIEVLGRWIDKGGLKKPELPIIEPDEAREVFDKKGALERLGGDEELFQQISGMFLDDTPNQIERMQKQLKENDLFGLERQAHSLKGAAMYIGGNALQKGALAIELAARNGEVDKARSLVEQIQKEYEKLKAMLGLDKT